MLTIALSEKRFRGSAKRATLTLLSVSMTGSALLAGPFPTSTVLAISPTQSVLGESVILMATVSPSSAPGKVAFYGGATFLGTGKLNNGQAQLKTALLPAGGTALYAEYLGSIMFGPSLSPPVTATVSASAGLALSAAVAYALPAFGSGAAVGDFNRDGKTDFVMTTTAGISVFLNNGDGTFGAPANISTTSPAQAAAVADFNLDGKADVAFTSTNGVSILLGNGDGAFQPAVNYAAGQGPAGIVVADFNGDGRPDVAVANAADNTVSILLGRGTGGFQPPLNSAVAPTPIALGVSDLNGDGIADLAVTHLGTSTVGVLLGKGHGTFQPEVQYNAGNETSSVAAADFNGDGYPDLAVVNQATPQHLNIFLGNGDGTFQSVVHYPTGKNPNTVALSDFNGDGIPDLIVSNGGNGGSGTYGVYYGKGDGTFLRPSRFVPTPGDADYVVTGEFNGDGRADALVVAGAVNSNHVDVLFGISFQAAISPANGSADSQVFTLSYTDPAGYQNLNALLALFSQSGALPAANNCFFGYSLSSNLLFLYDDAGTGIQGTLTPGGPGMVANSQCAISSGGAVNASGDQLSVPVAVAFTPAYAGSKYEVVQAITIGGDGTGWLPFGTWFIP